MASLTQDDVKKVAALANLTLTNEELSTYTDQLSAIIGYMDELSEVDTENVEPTSQTTGLVNVFREDELDETQQLTQEEALSGAENTKDGYIVVPHVFANSDE